MQTFETYSDTHVVRHLVALGETQTLCGRSTALAVKDVLPKRRQKVACVACAKRLKEQLNA